MAKKLKIVSFVDLDGDQVFAIEISSWFSSKRYIDLVDPVFTWKKGSSYFKHCYSKNLEFVKRRFIFLTQEFKEVKHDCNSTAYKSAW